MDDVDQTAAWLVGTGRAGFAQHHTEAEKAEARTMNFSRRSSKPAASHCGNTVARNGVSRPPHAEAWSDASN